MLVCFLMTQKKWVCLLLQKYLCLKGIPAKFYTTFENNIMIHSFLIKINWSNHTFSDVGVAMYEFVKK